MEIFTFVRFHASPGNDEAVATALRDVMEPTREEPGCLGINAFRSTRDASLFYFHARWADDAAFDRHLALPHTVRFTEKVSALIDRPIGLTRTHQIG